jgi:hypothetical protein
VALLTTLVVTASVTVASGEIVGLNDPAHDVSDGRADITRVVMSATESTLGFTATLRTPVNPRSDAKWRNFDAGAVLAVDTNADGTPDFLGLIVADPTGALHAGFFDYPAENFKCSGTATFVPGIGVSALFSVPACLPHGTRKVRWGVEITYGSQSDTAPDAFVLAPALALLARSGYWMLGAEGTVYGFGKAIAHPSSIPHAVAMTTTFDGLSYWVVDSSGHVYGSGDAGYHGGAPALLGGEFVSSISATPTAKGYWLFTNKGRAFPFGDAKFLGDMRNAALVGPVVASVATPTGLGYYMVGSDGGIFSFGDAKFRGSMGGKPLAKPIVGIAPTPDNSGYWLVGSDGGVFAFNAPFRGSMGGESLNRPVNGLVAFGNGYLMVASDGGVFDFSNKPFFGSLAGRALSAPIIGIAAVSV